MAEPDLLTDKETIVQFHNKQDFKSKSLEPIPEFLHTIQDIKEIPKILETG